MLNEKQLKYLEVIEDMVFQVMDFTLNWRQSGHPGGSHSKTPMFLALLFSGHMKFDIRNPEHPLGDRFILSAGHTIPMVYSTLAVIAEAFRKKYEETGDKKYYIDPEKIVLPEDMMKFRHRGGLSGHAEFAGKTLLIKYNTGPSGHGLPASVGEAFALKRAGLSRVKVWAIEGEGGLTPGGSHEAKNSAYGLGVGNLFWLIDWNDFGIDDRPFSSVVHGTPEDWFAPYGWHVLGTPEGTNYKEILRVLTEAVEGATENRPNVIWFRTRKGYKYGKYDNKSHGSAHKPNSPEFWESRKYFMEKYGIEFEGAFQPAPSDPEAFKEQTWTNIQKALSLFDKEPELVNFIVDRLIEIAESVPTHDDVKETIKVVTDKDIFEDPELWDYEKYPEDIFFKPGQKAANRNALKTWGAYINYLGWKKYGQPIFLAASADLTESTNLDGFGKGYGEFEGWGWYDRVHNPNGALLPQPITEFANAAISTGVGATNVSEDVYGKFAGFYMATSTYGSFAYLKYGPYRLYSQMVQDCELKLGKVLWVAGHSGPETAEDSRTHFGIFSTGVTQLFPDGQVVNLYPWEANEVPVVLGAAFREKFPIVILHLTRPKIEIPDREKLGIPHYFEAAKGAYLIRDFKEGEPKDGVLIVRGTMSTYNLIKILPELDKKYNLKIVAAISRELFDLQSDEYKKKVLPREDYLDSTIISNEARKVMRPWISSFVSEMYAMTSDWDNRWRTGGSVDEVVEEAHLDPEHLLEGIKKFVEEKRQRRRLLNIPEDR